jgi:pyochelin biosynthetic protein PchC
VSRRLDPLPQLLMVSGRRPPHLLRPRDLYRQGDEALVAHVQGLGEVGTSVLAEPELRELILPAIRADYTVVGTYRPDVLPPIAVPIVAYGGAADVDAPPADLARWAELSSLGFALRSFPGGHFYLQHAQRALIDDVALRLEALHTSRT